MSFYFIDLFFINHKKKVCGEYKQLQIVSWPWENSTFQISKSVTNRNE